MRKGKIIIKILIILSIVSTVLGIAATRPLAATDEIPNENSPKMEYEYNEKTNQVIAKIVSNIELKDTKPTWKLSEDKKVYTKVYNENMNYSTPVEDINGNKYQLNIDIKDVLPTQIDIKYELIESMNQVKATIYSNTMLNDTKPTWNLSEDRMSYEKIYNDNMEYSTVVEDINGKRFNIDVNITQVEDNIVKVDYSYDKETNKVLVTITSKNELKDTKPTWSFGEDKLTYTKIYDDNMSYDTYIEEINGRVTTVHLEIDKIDKEGPKITIDYRMSKDGNITLYLRSNEEMGATKPTWDLSEDRLTYTKIYSGEQNYTTEVRDIYGNLTIVPINFKYNKITYDSNIDIGYVLTSQGTVIAQIISNVELQDTKPTWELSEDKLVYSKTYTAYEKYTTQVVDINGNIKVLPIEIDYLYKIPYGKGTYGQSGARVKGKSGGSDLVYYKFGDGPNVLFTTFAVHGYEDSWARDGQVLTGIANDFYNRLISDGDKDLSKKWTIYIFPQVNPDGINLGTTKDGPGRTTVYSQAAKGIDINRSWKTESTYQIYTNARNYNGTEPFQAYEAAYLRDFLLSHKSQNGKTILVDLHGWEDQLIGDAEICQYYKQQYASCRTTGYGRYGTQYLITWARQNLGAKVSLVELPLATSQAQVNSMNLSGKYVQATINMLKGM